MQERPADSLASHQLSQRGERLVADRPVPGYIDEHFSRVEDRWDPESNPNGYVPMCMAENKIVWDLLEPKMAASRRVPQRVTEYDAMVGTDSFRQALARFLSERVLGRPIEATQVAALAGSGTVLETVFYALADPGEAILIPTPSYAGFWPDIETRDELQVVPVHTSSADYFRLSPELLSEAADRSPQPVRALLFTSPNNPTGQIYTAAELDEIIDWADSRGIHLILDELFALSAFGESEFVSGASRRPALGERRHVVWAFSKDFAASGLRGGVLVSENEGLLQAVDGLAYWGAMSGDTQFLLEQFVADFEWADAFVAENQQRLGDAYRRVTAALEDGGIPYLPAEAGFFFLCDMRRFLPEVTWEAEEGLWRFLLEEVNVNLTPGAACHIGEPGFMRLVFSSERTDAVVAGVKRMTAALANR